MAAEGDGWRGSGLVLVIDDEETVRMVTARALEYMGFDVLTAEDGAAGVELFELHQEKTRCVLMDMTMPRMSGEAAFTRIQEMQPNARVVLMSGYDEHEAGQRFPVAQLAGFLQKPFDLPTLGEVIRRAVEE